MAQRNLNELNPHWIAGGDITTPVGRCGFSFLCPVCPSDRSHHIAVFWDKGGHPHRNVWAVSERDNFEKVSVEPSVLADTSGRCKFHGWVRGGVVTW